MQFLQQNALYVVGIIAAVTWLGIFLFLFSIERRVRRLEKEETIRKEATPRNVRERAPVSIS